MFAAPPTATPCQGRSWLFESTNPTDHLEAATHCRTCPALDWCREWTKQSITATNREGAIEGTWAGELYGGTPGALRILREDRMFTDEEARDAHAAFVRGERSSRVRVGERTYQRRIARKQPRRLDVA